MKTEKRHMHKRAFLVWLAIYPLITLLIWIMGEYIGLLPLVIRTLVLTIIAVPIVYYWILPFYNRVFHKWLNK